MRDLFQGLLLNPRMNAKYELKVQQRLERAVTKLEAIHAVRYIKCSFPSVDSDAPQLQLRRWESLDESEWEVRSFTNSAFTNCMLIAGDESESGRCASRPNGRWAWVTLAPPWP